MQRPVWLFSMDTEQFSAPPLTTGALKAHHLAYSNAQQRCDIELVHFLQVAEIARWIETDWPRQVRPRASAALAAGLEPVFGLSCYTWNVAEFLEIAHLLKTALPTALVVAGGPHVQRAEDYVGVEAIDLVVVGEGEATFTEILDCTQRGDWQHIRGCAFLDGERVVRTESRPRQTELDRLPSALGVIALRDADGEPRYERAAYETSRGCPFRCAFCEWGTGAIGTKMHQLSLARIRDDLERLIAGGIHDIWFCDSNFGALREDEAKAELLVELRARSGRPHTFATSWSKNHNERVQRIVRLLHRNGLLWHYHLALQTLTPRALELSNRTNMRANDYEPIVKSLAADGVPVAAELIWGLPGDTLGEFERNLEHLMTIFPGMNIFGYTLLPGTEFYELRDRYQLETLPVAGYGKAKGEYVVGCHTFSRDEGEEGYALITGYLILGRGNVIPRMVRYLALSRRVRTGELLRAIMRALLDDFGIQLDRMAAYEQRAELYLRFLNERERAFGVMRETVADWLAGSAASDLTAAALRVLEIDAAMCPRVGAAHVSTCRFSFAADRAEQALGRMELPEPAIFGTGRGVVMEIDHTARVGEVLLDPDGGEWMRGRILSVADDSGRALSTGRAGG
ncbi:MAG: B12-binding domain-containing radical SAM protein [Myxococcales bacterium]|nr:MAG: B12-binding domain-containing radical SAM protein [Myxococcales bacterium]